MLDYGEESIKVIVVGDGNVGKTCMLRRFVKGDFIEHYRKTIGAEFLEKDVFLRSSNSTVKLMLWDTAGQEVFNALTQAYYRGAGAAILTFSAVDRDSFMNVAGWKQRVESVCGLITMVLCQTKFDLSHEAVITNEEAEQLAAQLELPLFRVSSKDDFNVTQLFEFTAQQCVENAAQDNRDEGREDIQSSGHLEKEEDPTPVASAATESSMILGKDLGSAGAHAAEVPYTGAASPSSFTAVGRSGASREGCVEKTISTAGKSNSGRGRERGRPSSSTRKVTLTEPGTQARHEKRRFKCFLY
ncbi:hypothetical protein JKF63_00909 [Porcisia hertigi]|uniref:Small G-protein n=1 Tax=Porcisia hertigi TaxID=2761500 RepID=A0A836HQT4_9TRYP|nr:hypothetical protein JKF63_00909 [Porcisia hertigi]